MISFFTLGAGDWQVEGALMFHNKYARGGITGIQNQSRPAMSVLPGYIFLMIVNYFLVTREILMDMSVIQKLFLEGEKIDQRFPEGVHPVLYGRFMG